MIKRRNNFIVILFFLFFSKALAQERYVNMFLNISFSPTSITISEFDPDIGKSTEETYTGTFHEGKPLSVFKCENGKELYVLKSSEILIIYDDEKLYPDWGVTRKKYRNAELFILDSKISSTSFLTEPSFTYVASNLGDIRLDHPWCEGENDDGKGVLIDMGSCGSGFLISNGFVSKRHYLYNYNNRVKSIKLTDVNDPKFSKIIELQDKAEPQYIFIDEQLGRHIIIEILDTYPGSKWNDTCINFIIKMFNKQ